MNLAGPRARAVLATICFTSRSRESRSREEIRSRGCAVGAVNAADRFTQTVLAGGYGVAGDGRADADDERAAVIEPAANGIATVAAVAAGDATDAAVVSIAADRRSWRRSRRRSGA
jgi:hypothetical protein